MKQKYPKLEIERRTCTKCKKEIKSGYSICSMKYILRFNLCGSCMKKLKRWLKEEQ